MVLRYLLPTEQKKSRSPFMGIFETSHTKLSTKLGGGWRRGKEHQLFSFPGFARSSFGSSSIIIKVKVKVKFTLEQAMKAQRRSRGIALLFL